MQEISINLPIIFQILFLTEELTWEDKIRLNIENNYAFVKMVKLAILFEGIVKYCLQIELEGVETFAESIKVKKYISGKYRETFFVASIASPHKSTIMKLNILLKRVLPWEE